MTPKQFVATYSQVTVKETAASQSHFNDVCRLIGHLTPLQADPKGEFFTFEQSTEKVGGKRGRADAFYRGKFIWEYKGPHANLDKAYKQLLLYRDALENPPLLITSDIYDIYIHTNFTNTVKQVHKITHADILDGSGVELLRRAFNDPHSFKPTQTQAHVTKATADTFLAVVRTLRQWEGETTQPERQAHFIIRLLFCLFAEDLGLLPEEIFTNLINYQGRRHFEQFSDALRNLFNIMKDGGYYGHIPVPHFNGRLFDDDYVPDLPSDIIDQLARAARQDWSSIDPTIFGTLFERVIDEQKRAQLGAHYTSRDDIMLIVQPVLMQPLRDEWDEVRPAADRLLRRKKDPAQAHQLLADFAHKIATTTVLDPACGSGNFLYVALRQLLTLQKEVIIHADRSGLPPIPLTVGPQQLYGIEINPYAHELAQITIWIGYLQWRAENGFDLNQTPILQPLDQIQNKDAILAYDAKGNPIEPEWPVADVIIGNPPFLGGQKLLRELGEKYAGEIRDLYPQLSDAVDLVTYWFEKARENINLDKSTRAGLIATQSIRAGVNRTALERIKTSGDVFLGWSDRPWILDGAAVRVSIVGFDDGSQEIKHLNGELVQSINSDLSHLTDLTKANPLAENFDLSFKGIDKSGQFELDFKEAKSLLKSTNESGKKNSDVVKLWINGLDITRRPRNMWIIDFDEMTLDEAQQYRKPLQRLIDKVKPKREKNREKRQRELWWQFARPRPAMRDAIRDLERFVVTTRVFKHRTFVFITKDAVPDSRLYVFAREDDYFFGILHSWMHEVWSLSTSSRHGVGNDPTYNNTTCFETFPFPWPPGQEPAPDQNDHVAAIAEAARELVAFRQAWLNPPAAEIGITIAPSTLKRRTLTNMYNALVHYRDAKANATLTTLDFRQGWAKAVKSDLTIPQAQQLDDIHTELDHAVLRAYGWPTTLTDEQILERLLALNLKRAATQNE